MPVKTSEREYRDVDLSLFECRTMENGQDVVEGYATTWDEYLLWDECYPACGLYGAAPRDFNHKIICFDLFGKKVFRKNVSRGCRCNASSIQRRNVGSPDTRHFLSIVTCRRFLSPITANGGPNEMREATNRP